MARGVNKVILIGNLGQDPQSKPLNNGSLVTAISLATSQSWSDKTTGELKTETEWHRVVFYNKLAEITQQYLKKGSKIYVEGRLKTKRWDDNGQTKYATEVIGHEMQMLGDNNNNSATVNKGRDLAPVETDIPDFDDDIPF